MEINIGLTRDAMRELGTHLTTMADADLPDGGREHQVEFPGGVISISDEDMVNVREPVTVDVWPD